MARERIYNHQEAADEIGVTAVRLYQLREDGEIQAIESGLGKRKRFFYLESQVKKLAAQNEIFRLWLSQHEERLQQATA